MLVDLVGILETKVMWVLPWALAVVPRRDEALALEYGGEIKKDPSNRRG